MSKLCALLGHRRNKKRMRQHLDTWRSKCLRCGVAMVRDSSGRWDAAPGLSDLFGPSLASSSEPLAFPPAKTPAVAPLVVAGLAPIDHLPFPENFASKVLSAFPHAAARPEHYAARSAEARRLAEAAKDPAVALIHLDMATRYEVLSRLADHSDNDDADNAVRSA